MTKWTPEQQRAIDERNSNILVAAAAGSGKTAVLVERIIQRILDENDPLNIDELLIATFTNAAAEEMKQRIGEALDDALQKSPTSYHLKKQLSLLQRASISTIHSFCMNVVREYSYLLDIDPAFRIADDMEIDLLKHEVLDELFEEWYGQEGDEVQSFFNVIDMFSNDRSDVDVENLILKLHTFAKQNPWPERWLEKVAEQYHVDEHIDEANLPWLSLLKHEIKERLDSFEITINKAKDIANEADGPSHYIEALDSDLTLIATAKEKLNKWDELQQFFVTSEFKNLSRKKFEGDEAKKKAVQNLRNSIRENWNKIKEDWFKRSLTNHLKDMEKLYPVVKELVRLVMQFEERFQQVKRERAIVDFNDLEHFALQILIEPSSVGNNVTPSKIARYYENRFKEILVDEYQDINLVQETIIQSISKKTGRGNVFMVGDVKQSIYRFRHAEPSLFIDKYETFAVDQQVGTRIDLAKNFRSRENILTGSNFIFRQIFDEHLGEISYDKSAELVYGNTMYDEVPLAKDQAELIIINEDDDTSNDEEKSKTENLKKEQLEARVYAQKINEWIGKTGKKPLQVTERYKDENQKNRLRFRNVEYRDIVILLRSLTSAPTIVEELKQQGIPVYAELKTGYFKAIEIQVMLNMLKIIDNPYQDIPLASVLRSPIVGLNEEQLAQIRLAKKNVSFYDAVREASETNDELAPMLNPFLVQLETFRTLAREGALSELIWNIFQKTGYYDYVGGIPGGRQRQANLRALYDRARSYEETSFRGLFRFLRFIERMEEKENDLGEARALSEQENVVRIMTIHKSKGLEFPIVILGGINKEFNFSDFKGKYLLNKELGFATKYIDPIKRITYSSLYYLGVREEEKRLQLSEEIRVLYVALTRAKEKLVMVGTVKKFEELVEKWREVEEHDELILPIQLRKNAKKFLDWIGPALIRHQDSHVLRENKLLSQSVPVEIQNDPSSWHVEVIHKDEIMEPIDEGKISEEELQTVIQTWKSVPPERKNAHLDETVRARLQFDYDYKQAQYSRAKQSVTEIKRRRETTDEYSEQRFVRNFTKIASERPQFLKKTKQLTRAEIGTAMHTVMQHIPLDEDWNEEKLIQFVDQLVDEEKLTSEEARYIDIEGIVQFFNTNIANMMKQYKVEREMPFSYTLSAKQLYRDEWEQETDEKVLIQGVIDCMIFTDEGVILVDYKTDQIYEDEITEPVIQNLQDRYRVQIELYKQALENILQQPVIKSYLYFFSKKLSIEL